MGLFTRKTKVSPKQLGAIWFHEAVWTAAQLEEVGELGPELGSRKGRFESAIFHMVALDTVLRKELSEQSVEAVRAAFFDAAMSLDSVWRVADLRQRIEDRFREYRAIYESVASPEDLARLGNAAAKHVLGHPNVAVGMALAMSFITTLKHWSEGLKGYKIIEG